MGKEERSITMHKQGRKIISKCGIGVCLGLLIVLINVIPTKAAEASPLSYIISDGSVTITDCNTSVKGALEIPETLGEYPVTSIGNRAFYECRNLTSIKIPEGVTSIGSEAFRDCSSLTSIQIPKGVTSSIGPYTFSGCSSLRSIEIPEGITDIGSFAFRDCRGLKSIQIPKGVTYIGAYAFFCCSGLTSIQIPERVTSIGTGAFYECSGLTSIKISEKVTSIGNSAFSGCSSLTSIQIPEGVTSIGDSTFYGCSGLTSIKIPEGVTSIGHSAFYGCSGLTSIQIPEGITNIRDGAFSGCSSLTSIQIPERVTSIGNSTFYGCSGLTSIHIPEGITSIGFSAFSGCRGLTSIHIPEGITSICDGAFSGCSSLTSIKIPEGVISIENFVFSGCSSLTSIKIPEGVTSIGNSAFYGCSSLISIKIPEGIMSIGDSAFSGCSCLTNIEIPKGVTSIGNSAFYGCSGLTSIKIPEGVTSIGNSAFYGCSGLTSIQIPEGITSIGSYAFFCCRSLTCIQIPEGVTSIAEGTFSGCSSLTNIEIPERVTSIRENAFSYCGLTSVNIPSSVMDIRKNAFDKNVVLYVNNVYVKQYAIDNNLKYTVVSGAIRIETKPNKIEYCQNEKFDKSGLKIIVDYYKDGSSEEVTDKCTISGFNSSTLGVSTIIVKYKEFETTFNVNIYAHSYDAVNDLTCNRCGHERAIASITIKTLPVQTSYCIGEATNYEGLIVRVKYDDGSIEEIDKDFELNGFDSSVVGVSTVIVKYKGFETSYKVEIHVHSYDDVNDFICNKCGYERAITSITIKTLPVQTSYGIGEVANYEGLIVCVKYDDGSIEEIAQGFELSGFDSSVVGVSTIDVNYKGFKTSFKVDVHVHSYDDVNDFICNECGHERAITCIDIKTLPFQTSYGIGEAANYEGLIVRVKYDDGSIEEIARDFELSGFDSNVVGVATVGVNYKGFKTSFEVDVHVHSFDKWQVVRPATMQTEGLEKRICSVCSHEETRSIDGIWRQNSTGWWYQRCNGTYPVNCWEEISDIWYYFNASGYMVTGWQAIGGTWYYFNGSGAMVTGWQAIGGAWYYFNGSGAMAANQWVGNYYLQSDGSMATNRWIGNYWVGSDGQWIPN